MKNKVVHTTNVSEKVLVRYETPEGQLKTIILVPDWYFAILNKDVTQAQELLLKAGVICQFVADPNFPDFTKIYCNTIKREKEIIQNKYQVAVFLEKQGIQTFEGDLTNDKRWFIDNQIEISSNYKKLYFDIETDDSIEKIEVGRDRILSWAAIDSEGMTHFAALKDFTDEAEEELLLKFLKLISKYDLLLGWNSSGFDVPYLKMRMQKYELNRRPEYCWKEVAHFDLLKRFRHIFRFDSHIRTFSLEYISQHFLGKGKVKHTEKIIELWRNDKKKLKEYNLEDSILVKELDEKLGVSAMMIRQCQWCGVPVGQFGLYSIIDSHILKTAHRVGQFCRTSLNAITERDRDHSRVRENPNDATKTGAKYMGAIVLDPKIGKYGGVHTFDFKGLYPSLIRTSNIGYDTLRYEAAGTERLINPGTAVMNRKAGIVKPTYFEKTPSVINLAISELITKRSEYKKLKLKMIEEHLNSGVEWERVVSDEIIVKELANSTYGIMGLEYGRYFSVDVAESITLFGQWCILFAKKVFEDLGYQVIYGDTDSVFVVTGKKEFDVEKHLDIFHAALKKELKEKYNINDVFIQLEFDKQYETLILVEKKTYVGHVVNIERKKTSELYARGLDYHKKNAFSFAAQKQKKLIEYIIYKNPTKQEVKVWLARTRGEFFNSVFSKEDLRITQKVGKPLLEYTGTPPPHVRLAMELAAKTGQNFVGQEIEYIVVGCGKNVRGILAEEFTGQYDKDYYWENKTLPLLQRVTNVVYPGEPLGGTQSTIFDFLSY